MVGSGESGRMIYLDKFIELIDNFLKKEEVYMLVKLPEGTLEAEVEDNVGAGSVIQFFFLLQAFESIVKQMKSDMGIKNKNDWEPAVDGLLKILRKDLLEVK